MDHLLLITVTCQNYLDRELLHIKGSRWIYLHGWQQVRNFVHLPEKQYKIQINNAFLCFVDRASQYNLRQ